METTTLIAGVKYCGHCNPHKDGPTLVRGFQAQLPGLKVVPWEDVPEIDVLLLVSACPIACVSQPPFQGARIEIVAGVVRKWLIPPGHLAEKLLVACLMS